MLDFQLPHCIVWSIHWWSNDFKLQNGDVLQDIFIKILWSKAYSASAPQLPINQMSEKEEGYTRVMIYFKNLHQQNTCGLYMGMDCAWGITVYWMTLKQFLNIITCIGWNLLRDYCTPPCGDLGKYLLWFALVLWHLYIWSNFTCSMCIEANLVTLYVYNCKFVSINYDWPGYSVLAWGDSGAWIGQFLEQMLSDDLLMVVFLVISSWQLHECVCWFCRQDYSL